MSETTSTSPGGPVSAPGAEPVSGVDLRDLGDLGVLDEVASARRQADRQDARLLAAVVAYVDLHPVVDPDDAAGWPAGGTPPGSKPERAPLAGPGTPLVAEYTVEALGAVLHQPYRTTLSLVADAVELCFRLPRLWALVQDGSLQTWKARQAAHETTHLCEAAVGFVDRHLAVTAARNPGPPQPVRADPRSPAALRPRGRGRPGTGRPGPPRRDLRPS